MDGTFNEEHILAISQAIQSTAARWADGPFLGMDTHALSGYIEYGHRGVRTTASPCVQAGRSYTPDAVISHAILTYNRGRTSGLMTAVITPSHKPAAGWRL